jgi:signal transduction histidine kinase
VSSSVVADDPEAPEDPDAEVDLRALVAASAGRLVKIAAPGMPVTLPAFVARQVAAAVGAALDNVRVHVGPDAPAWVLIEDEGYRVVVSVRDEGPGFPRERLAEAESGGRLGVAQSIVGRMLELGGEAVIHSEPGQGTEVELRVPRS